MSFDSTPTPFPDAPLVAGHKRNGLSRNRPAAEVRGYGNLTVLANPRRPSAAGTPHCLGSPEGP
jgi:hypothetical protein